MKLEDLCVSLELARELEQAGYPQDSYFFWEGLMVDIGKVRWRINKKNNNHNPAKYAAPTTSEIGKQLPEYVGDEMSMSGECFLEMYKDSSNGKGEEWYLVRYVENGGMEGSKIMVGYNEPREVDARAKMWLYLKRNNLLKEGE